MTRCNDCQKPIRAMVTAEVEAYGLDGWVHVDSGIRACDGVVGLAHPAADFMDVAIWMLIMAFVAVLACWAV